MPHNDGKDGTCDNQICAQTSPNVSCGHHGPWLRATLFNECILTAILQVREVKCLVWTTQVLSVWVRAQISGRFHRSAVASQIVSERSMRPEAGGGASWGLSNGRGTVEPPFQHTEGF